jgi:DNA polymerase III subunit gamma/tau
MGQALYRKYRTKTFAETVGQEHITTTLANALKQGRISHAYLLTGPKGVGKTSVARILAHEINGLPYTDEAHLDIIEIDAASNRRIDEIRDLRDRVSTAPASAKYKVYIIDEVHMLTREAFNALLKTLEEPPAHVVFILATTEAHKLPETIISRTQRYTFRPVPAKQVIAHLKHIAESEKITIDDEALALIAAHGDGSFRDSISLLDQASNTSSAVTRADVERILGLAPAEQIAQLSAALDQQDKVGIVSELSSLYASGYEPATIAMQLSAVLRQAIIDNKANTSTIDLLRDLLDIAGSRNPRQLLELVLLRTAVAATAAPQSQPVQAMTPAPPATTIHTKKLTPESTSKIHKSPEQQPAASTTPGTPIVESAPSDETTTTKKPVQPPGPLSKMELDELWQQTLDEIKKRYNTLYGIARMAQPDFDGTTLHLGFKFGFHQKRMNEVKNRKIFGDVISKLYGSPVEISCIILEPAAQTSEAPDVSAVSNIFGGAELIES